MIELATTRIREQLGPNGENWIQGKWTGEDGERCLHGAIRECQPQPGDAYLIEAVANREGWGTGWNDAGGTEWADIDNRLTVTTVVTDADLEETFGPNWELIVRLVRQAAQLTPQQVEQLNAAWVAVRVAVMDAAMDAVMDAAWGLVVKDLIGRHGFTQQHYDTLTGPWRAVFPGFDK